MHIVEVILLTYFGYVSFYSFILSFAGLFYKTKTAPEARIKRKFAVLIPAYKEDGVIVSVAEQALEQDYPAELYDVIIIADSLKRITVENLKTLPIKVIEVSFDKSTKVKALNRAMQIIGDDYDCALILDADNVMQKSFVRQMNNLYEAGYLAVQGRRDPKNENTDMALLDGLSETINNFIYRQGTVAMGFSASLNGSGMMFDYKAYKSIMANMDSIGGFDRELELKLLERGIKVHFARNVIVYDEKVANTEVFERQRKRWISSQFFYLRKYFFHAWRLLLHGNVAYFNSAVLRNIQLPRLLNLGLLSVCTLLSFVVAEYLRYSPWVWFAFLALSITAIVFAIPKRFYTARLLKSILLIPKIFFKMFLLLFKLRGANKTFIHTPHGQVETKS